jgi:geranylgeranyl pyrophosphate synthase
MRDGTTVRVLGGDANPADNGSAAARAGAVFAFLDDLIAGLDGPASYQALLRVHVGEGRAQLARYPLLPAVHVPLLVHAALTGAEAPALPVAAACTLVYLGADLFDNLADGELPACWAPWGAGQASLAAATLLAALPGLALARLADTAAARRWELAHLFAASLATMSAGQHDDLRFAEAAEVTPAICREMVERKSGAEGALFATAGAMLARADAGQIAHYAAFGRCLGSAVQLASDLADLWGAGPSQDLLTGKQTLPIAHALTVLAGTARSDLLAQLAAARETADAHPGVQATLAGAGSLRYTALVVGVYRQEGLRHLAAAVPRQPAATALRALLDNVSLLPGTA